MEPKRTKYDTNPLDEKVADRAEQSRAPAPTEGMRGGATREIGSTTGDTSPSRPESEAPTRRIEEKFVTSYPSVFVSAPAQQPNLYQPPQMPLADIYLPPPGPPPNVYQPPPHPSTQRPGSHSVAGLNIPERWANMLPYLPGHLGAIASVIELILVPRSESRTRFHAAQGLALQLAILILTGALQFVTLLTSSSLGSGIVRGASTVFLIVSMIRVWQQKPHHIAPLDEPAKWLNEKIKPRR